MRRVLLDRARHRHARLSLTLADARWNLTLRPALGLAGELDVVVGSAALHQSKPDPEIFRRTALLPGASCPECAFVDDEPRHVVTAEPSG